MQLKNKSSGNFINDFKLSVKIVWIIYSLLILIILLLAFFLPEILLRISPVCLSKSLYGEECFMCGMTRAFIKISGGNFQDANAMNNFSLYLFSIFVLNSIIFFCYICIKIFKKINLKNQIQTSLNFKN